MAQAIYQAAAALDDDEAPCFALIFAREPDGWTRTGGGHQDFVRATYTPEVRECLHRVDILPQRIIDTKTPAWTGKDWHGALAPIKNCIIGAMLVRGDFVPDVLSFVDKEQRSLLDFYRLHGRFQEQPILFCRIIRVWFLHAPFHPGFLGAQRQRGLFMRLTPWSVAALQGCHDPHGRTFAQVYGEWLDEFDVDELPGYDMGRAACMPGAHAFLLLGKVWTSWAFPLTLGRRAGGMRLNLASDLFAGVDIPAAGMRGI